MLEGNLTRVLSSTGREMDYENPEIIYKEKNLTKRIFLETLSIKNTTPNLNFKNDSSKFSSLYNNIFQSFINGKKTKKSPIE